MECHTRSAPETVLHEVKTPHQRPEKKLGDFTLVIGVISPKLYVVFGHTLQ